MLVQGSGTLKDDALAKHDSHASGVINMDGKAREKAEAERDVPRKGPHGP